MPSSRPFSLSASVQLDGTGAGVVQLGPSITNEQWSPSRVSVSCTANVTTGACEADIYCGAYIGQDTFKDGTFSGDTGDTTDAVNGELLWPGQFVFVQWSDGVPGAIATMRVQGTRTVP
jgi:hypothetical protein